MASYQSGVAAAIAAAAARYGVDPAAMTAVGRVESGLNPNAVGDGGHSVGLFQFNDLGAGKGMSRAQRMNPAFNADTAARMFAQSGGRGLRGAAAVRAFVTNFERPANPAAEIAKALGYLGSGGGGQQIPPLPQGQQPAIGAQQSNGFDIAKLRPVLAHAHAQAMNGGLDRHGLLAAIEGARLPMQAGGAPQLPTAGGGQSASAYGASTLPASMVGGGQLLGHQLDRAGMKTQPGILNFARQIAGIYGQPITLGTGTNHSQMTTNGTQSAHWTGHALDLPATGTQLMRMGQAALIAAGAPRAWAMKQKAGLFNIGRHQIIFGTNSPALGGNHTNHLHIGEK